jgi:AcrR family transcriptional regulator
MPEQDTKKRIVEASTYLFGVKGFDGTSTREIAKLAGVNIASLNYHFRSKQGLHQEVTACVIEEFKTKIANVAKQDLKSTAEFAQKLFETMTEDGPKMLNCFKLFLDAQNYCGEMEPYPIGHEEFSQFLKKELKDDVSSSERLWARDVIFNYIMHVAVMSATEVGKKHIQKHFIGKNENHMLYISQLVETLIRDLNQRHT